MTAAEKPCPICRRPAGERWRPFCSGRCADADLLRWLNGSYRIPGTSQTEKETDGVPATSEEDAES